MKRLTAIVLLLLVGCTSYDRVQEVVEVVEVDECTGDTTTTTTTTTKDKYGTVGNPKGLVTPTIQHNTDATAPGPREGDSFGWLVLWGWIALASGVGLALGRHAIPIPYLTTLSISGCMVVVAVGVLWIFAPKYGPVLTSMMLLFGGIALIVTTMTTGSASNVLNLFKTKKATLIAANGPIV